MESLIPPIELLFDGATSAKEFIEVGEGFTHENIIKRARLQPHERVLDIGSGNGQKARVLTRYLNQQGSYDGLEIVRSGVEWCQKAYTAFPNFRFTLASGLYNTHYNPKGLMPAAEYTFPYENESFDLVFLSSVFTHLMPDEVTNYLRETSRVLSPSGRCLATVFLLNAETLDAIVSDKAKIQFPIDLSTHRLRDARNPSMGVAYDEAWFRQTLSRSGLRLCEATYGWWSGGKDLLNAMQDTFIAVKPG